MSGAGQEDVFKRTASKRRLERRERLQEYVFKMMTKKEKKKKKKTRRK